jgi:hypothetical protein
MGGGPSSAAASSIGGSGSHSSGAAAAAGMDDDSRDIQLCKAWWWGGSEVVFTVLYICEIGLKAGVYSWAGYWSSRSNRYDFTIGRSNAPWHTMGHEVD